MGNAPPSAVDEAIKRSGLGESEIKLWGLDEVGFSDQDQDFGRLVEALTSNANLTSLTLCECGISAAGADRIAQVVKSHQSMTSLAVPSNYVGDAGTAHIAEALVGHESLRELQLWECCLGDAGAKIMAEALPRISSLEDLQLKHNGIGDHGAACLAAALLVNTSVKKLDLSGNHITKVGAAQLVEAVARRDEPVEILLQHNRVSARRLRMLVAASNQANDADRRIAVTGPEGPAEAQAEPEVQAADLPLGAQAPVLRGIAGNTGGSSDGSDAASEGGSELHQHTAAGEEASQLGEGAVENSVCHSSGLEGEGAGSGCASPAASAEEETGLGLADSVPAETGLQGPHMLDDPSPKAPEQAIQKEGFLIQS